MLQNKMTVVCWCGEQKYNFHIKPTRDTFANGERSDDMPHYVAFHQGLQCLIIQNRSSLTIITMLTCSKSCVKWPL